MVADALLEAGRALAGYCEAAKKAINPLGLPYAGSEKDPAVIAELVKYDYIVCIGDNIKRRELTTSLREKLGAPVNAIHPRAYIARQVTMGCGVMVGAGAIINPVAEIGDGVICNTGSIVEHGCVVGAFSHIAPSATILGNVHIGEACLIGGNAVIKPGVTIGDQAVIGAGAVVLSDVAAGAVVAGNPHKEL